MQGSPGGAHRDDERGGDLQGAGDAAPARTDLDVPVGAEPARVPRVSRFAAVFERGLAASLVLVLVPVVVLVLSALGAFVYGTVVFIDSVRRTVDHPIPVGNKIGLFLLVVDLFLIGATLLIAGLGFYELFIDSVAAGSGLDRMPAWLQMSDLNDLKARVVAMIVLVAAVSFVEVLVDEPHPRDLLELGGGVSLVIAALTAFLRYGSQAHGRD